MRIATYIAMPARVLAAVLVAALAVTSGLRAQETDSRATTKTDASARAERRLFDGAPPVMPHAAQGAVCTACHNEHGIEVPGLGFAPPSPHDPVEASGSTARCAQCHVGRVTEDELVASSFEGLEQDMRQGARLGELSPPVIPHAVLMRENCQACHTGPAAREEIRTSHPERQRCRQCHLERVTSALFEPGLDH